MPSARTASRRWSFRLALALAVSASLAPSSASAAPLRSSAFLTYALGGEETVDTDGRRFEKISVFAYHVTEDGDVVPSTSWVPDTVDHLAASYREQLFLVTANNRILDERGRPGPFHGGDTTFEILADPDTRAEHVRQLAAIAESADGIELNYENLPPQARPYFTALVRELRAALSPGKKLSIVLQPKTTNAPGDRGRAVDWREIEPYADYLRIMAYYYSYSTSRHGPAVPMDTLRELADFALHDPLEGIPRHKLSIILTFWGWDWPMPEGRPGRLVPLDEAMDLARRYRATPVRDPREHSLRFGYTDGDGVDHEVWIDDFESLRRRIELLESAGVPRVDFWHLNTGDPRLWSHLRGRTADVRFAGTNLIGGLPTDLGIFRQGVWYLDRHQNGGTDFRLRFGREGDVPVPLDYDGDGTTDVAFYRPSTGLWALDLDRDGKPDTTLRLGAGVPVPADYDGDGRSDPAVFDPSTGSWTIDTDHDGSADRRLVHGLEGDVPVPGDYDGNGSADPAVFRPADGTWHVDRDGDGRTDFRLFYGRAGDVPIPLDFDGDGVTDPAVYRPSYGGWFVDTDRNGGTDLHALYGRPGDVPVPGNYDGDGVADFALFRPAWGAWFVDTNRNGGTDRRVVYGRSGDVPLREGGWIHDALAGGG